MRTPEALLDANTVLAKCRCSSLSRRNGKSRIMLNQPRVRSRLYPLAFGARLATASVAALGAQSTVEIAKPNGAGQAPTLLPASVEPNVASEASGPTWAEEGFSWQRWPSLTDF
jgi:hypothetical protein